jgi:hypothetical protein
MPLEPLMNYETSTASAEAINDEIARILREASTDDERRAEFGALGVNPQALAVRGRPMLVAEARGSGVEPLSTGIAIVYATRFAYRVTNDVWVQIIMPELERRFGRGALQGGQPAPKKPKRTKKR